MIDKLYLRDNVIEKARSLYIPNITNNISIALEMFLKNDATENEKVPLVISRETRPASWVDAMGRPRCPRCGIGLSLNVNKNLWQCDICGFKINIKIKNCPECNRSMMLKPVNVSRCTRVDGNYNSVWMCINKDCMQTIYNEKTIQEILMEEKANGIS